MTKLHKLCIKWLDENYCPMVQFEMEKYPDYIFYMKDGNCILQYNKKNGVVYVNYDGIWSFFESFFSMEYNQIQDITKIWVEEQFKKEVTTTRRHIFCNVLLVEEQFKKEVTTTNKLLRSHQILVEEQFKKEVTTTPKSRFN